MEFYIKSIIWSFWSSIPMTLEIVLLITLLILLQKILYLSYHTPKQRKAIKWMLIGSLIFMNVAWSMQYFVAGVTNAKFEDTVYLFYLGLAPVVIPVLYSAVTGRKKLKWVGILALFPLVGYFDCILNVVTLPATVGWIEESKAENYNSVVFLILLLLILVMSKRKTVFIRNLERDIEHRILSFWEELGIWAVGIWLWWYTEDLSYSPSDSIATEITVYINVVNFIVALVVVLLILDSNYRKYYFNQVNQLQKSLITTMAELVENRDENTGGHIQRTAKYVEIIAKKLKEQKKFTNILTDKYIEDMVVAAPLHDVGKIHIPDAVLNKNGRLDDEEYGKMKTHAKEGSKIIDRVEESAGSINYLVVAKEMAEYHHERMDGKGYPNGLAGEQIPLCAKILAVADVFDALASKRCYKEPFPLEEAFAIIEKEKGDHFDPDVADAFLAAKDEVIEYLESYKLQQETETAEKQETEQKV